MISLKFIFWILFNHLCLCFQMMIQWVFVIPRWETEVVIRLFRILIIRLQRRKIKIDYCLSECEKVNWQWCMEIINSFGRETSILLRKNFIEEWNDHTFAHTRWLSNCVVFLEDQESDNADWFWSLFFHLWSNRFAAKLNWFLEKDAKRINETSIFKISFRNDSMTIFRLSTNIDRFFSINLDIIRTTSLRKVKINSWKLVIKGTVLKSFSKYWILIFWDWMIEKKDC
jgi:hypothetical protein